MSRRLIQRTMRTNFLNLVFRQAARLSVENPCNAALRHSSHFWDSAGKTEEAGSSRKQETTRDVFQDACPHVSVVPGYWNPTARDSSPASEGFLLSRS